MSEVNVCVSVKDEYVNQLLEVSQRLQAKGMHVDQLLDTVGVITGSIDSDKLNTLQDVEGVLQLESGQEFTAL
jgi:hypothetical protein